MKKTHLFRQQHVEIRALIARVGTGLNSSSDDRVSDDTVAAIKDLGAKISIHLAIEDQTLYPHMATHADAAIRALAVRFQSEMGGLKAHFDAFRQRYPGSLAIARDVVAFRAEAKEVLGALLQRINREDSDLYDVYDQAD